MGILARFFHFGTEESDKTPSDFPVDDRAVLAHIAANDEDPDVRKAARELLESDYCLRRK